MPIPHVTKAILKREEVMAPQQVMFTIMAMTTSKASGFSVGSFWGNGTPNTDICGGSRPTNCPGHSDTACACEPGHCVNSDGGCVRDPRVPENCHVGSDVSCYFYCSGDNQACDRMSHECTCNIGFCKDETGACVASSPPTCQKGTPGTCSIAACKESRGPTDCLSGVCFCQEGTCWSDELQTCASPSEAASLLASMSDDELASLAATPRNHLYPLAGVLLLAAGFAVATTRQRSATVSTEPLLANA